MISIIVPVYNVEKYLTICIESILNQTYKYFELLLIDDGSTDKSGIICDEFASKDKRVIVYHQKNQGVSSARNIGIKLSKGDFLCFIDSDDWVDATYISDLLVTNYEQYDLVFMNMADFLGKPVIYHKASISSYFGEEIKNVITCFNIFSYGGPYVKLFKKSIIIANKIFFPECIQYGEDTLFFLRYFSHIHSTCFINKVRYHYRDSGSQSLSKRIHDPLQKNYFYIREKNYVINLCIKYNCINTLYYAYFDYTQIKRGLINFFNCYILQYSFNERRRIWRYFMIMLKYRLNLFVSWKSFLLKSILLIVPFRLLDIVFKSLIMRNESQISK